MGSLRFNADATLGEGPGAFVIAEAGVNHNGDLALAERLIDAAADAGCDAVKFQTFKAAALAGADAQKAEYQKETSGAGESQLEMLRRLELPYEAHHRLIERCRERGILFLSTPFEEESADFLEALGLPLFKVPSGELTNLPFIGYVARKGRPLIMSTGMANLSEVEAGVREAQAAGAPLALMHCVSNYPARAQDSNLRAMETMRQAFGVPVGYSDHTLGIEVPIAAVAMGAVVIEKHFTLDRGMEGPDHAASLEPDELAAMMAGIRKVESALGDGIKRPVASELAVARVARKSVVAARDIAAGEVVTTQMLTCRRPATGLSPDKLPWLLGRAARRAIAAGTQLELGDVQ